MEAKSGQDRQRRGKRQAKGQAIGRRGETQINGLLATPKTGLHAGASIGGTGTAQMAERQGGSGGGGTCNHE